MVHIAVSWQHEHINMMLLDVLADHAALRKVVAYIVNLIKKCKLDGNTHRVPTIAVLGDQYPCPSPLIYHGMSNSGAATAGNAAGDVSV
jgi:hypothetical protein